MFGLVTLALASAASAMPLASRSHAEFPKGVGLAVFADNLYYSLTAVHNDTNPELFLMAQNFGGFPGTTAYFKGASPKASLNFDLNGNIYGAFVPDAGDDYGFASPVTLVKGYHDYNFYYDNTTVSHTLTAASNEWLACNRTINGATALLLSWGDNADNGSFPVGCTFASVHTNCLVGAPAPACGIYSA